MDGFSSECLVWQVSLFLCNWVCCLVLIHSMSLFRADSNPIWRWDIDCVIVLLPLLLFRQTLFTIWIVCSICACVRCSDKMILILFHIVLNTISSFSIKFYLMILSTYDHLFVLLYCTEHWYEFSSVSKSNTKDLIWFVFNESWLFFAQLCNSKFIVWGVMYTQIIQYILFHLGLLFSYGFNVNPLLFNLVRCAGNWVWFAKSELSGFA